jgi:hypothetical protein
LEDNGDDSDGEEIEVEPETPACNRDGIPLFPFYGDDSEQRMLLRNGIIDEIPLNVCEVGEGKVKKNVILVVGDGMGWEMVRAGAIARQIIDELEELGCDTKEGCPGLKEALDAFEGRTLEDYYTEGKPLMRRRVGGGRITISH